jgi:hypothetical protein
MPDSDEDNATLRLFEGIILIIKGQMSKSNTIGRPPKYKTPEELQLKIDDYFLNGVTKRTVLVGPANNKTAIEIPVPTITGLVRHCGFCDRHSFYDWENKPEFSHTVKRARNRIEQNYEELLQTTGGSGPIFALKNFGWKDAQEIEHKGESNKITIIYPPDYKPAEKSVLRIRQGENASTQAPA